MILSHSNVIARFLDTDGDGTGTKNATGNYSATADDFYIESTEILAIESVVVILGDAGSFNQTVGYGSEATALTNGWSLLVTDNDETPNTLLDLFDGVPVKQNRHLEMHGFEVAGYAFGSAPQSKGFRLFLPRILGGPLELQPGERLVARFNDDHSVLTEHYVKVYGRSRVA